MEYNDLLLISGIQHFLYCKRQWALIHVENQWQESDLTAEGRVMHHRVHDPDITDIRNGIITYRGVQVSSAQYGITGVCDAVEMIPDEDGITLFRHPGTWSVCPVEYKRGKSKLNDEDRLQVTAQVLCLEEMLSCHIERGSLFYGETKRREYLEITPDLRKKLVQTIKEMRTLYVRGETPRGKYDKRCPKCSLHDLCMPELFAKEQTVEQYITGRLQEVKEE